MAEHISANLRSLDASWQLQSKDGTQIVMILLPLINRKQSEGYLVRLMENIAKNFQIDLHKATNSCRVLQIDRGVTREDCVAFMQNKSKGKQKRGAAAKQVYNRKSSESSDVIADKSAGTTINLEQDNDGGNSSGEKAA